MAMVRLYTAQRMQILDILEQEGVYRVQQRFIDRKYGDSAWIFNEAYGFFREKASALVPRPAGADSAIWLFYDARNALLSEDSALLCFDVPEELVIPFDMRLWYQVLNLRYIGQDAGDERRFYDKLRNMGLTDSLKLFSTPFYLTQKQEVKDSWMRLFPSRDCELSYRQAGVWELRKEWLVRADFPVPTI